jgi:hypothetical protein
LIMAFETEPDLNGDPNFIPGETILRGDEIQGVAWGIQFLLGNLSEINLKKAYRLLNDTLGNDYEILSVTSVDHDSIFQTYETTTQGLEKKL